MSKNKDVYQIYDKYENESCVLSSGTIETVRAVFEQWLLEHIDNNDDFENEEDFYKQYPKAELFIGDPILFIKHIGNNDTEIYSGWLLKHLCTIEA
jgi:hypothetical protein